MDTPAKQQQRLWRDPIRFANDMEKRGRQQLSDPRTALAGSLLISGASDLRDHVKQQRKR